MSDGHVADGGEHAVPDVSEQSGQAQAQIVHSADSEEGSQEQSTSPASGSSLDFTGPQGQVTAVSSDGVARTASDSKQATGEDLANEVRERFEFLSYADQQTVCRRECQLAQDREAALLRQIQNTVDRYGKALRVSKAVKETVACGIPEDAAVEREGSEVRHTTSTGLTQEICEKYEARVTFLNEAYAHIQSEPQLSLPRLTALEHAKGLACAGFSKTARAANKLSENPAPLTEVKGALFSFGSSLASRWRPTQAPGGADPAPPVARRPSDEEGSI